MGGWARTFWYQVDGDLVRLTCGRCGGVLAFTHAATEETMRAEMRHHLYGAEIPWEPPDCLEAPQVPAPLRKTRPGASQEG